MMAMSDQVNTAPVTHGLRAAATGQKEKMIYSLTGCKCLLEVDCSHWVNDC